MEMTTCDILLYKGRSFMSRLIEWNTGSLYSHVSVVANARMNLAIESNTGSQSGVRALDLRKLQADEVDVYRVKPGQAFKQEQVISYLVASLGSHYDYPGVIWLGLLKLLRLKKQANKFQSEKDYFCSELVYEAFHSAGLDIVPQISEADITSPGDIARSPVLEKIKTVV